MIHVFLFFFESHNDSWTRFILSIYAEMTLFLSDGDVKEKTQTVWDIRCEYQYYGPA